MLTLDYDTGSRSHALLEVLWNTGLGAIHALDVRDYHPDKQFLEFCYRPESGTLPQEEGPASGLSRFRPPQPKRWTLT